jgi:hypothetical protein
VRVPARDDFFAADRFAVDFFAADFALDLRAVDFFAALRDEPLRDEPLRDEPLREPAARPADDCFADDRFADDRFADDRFAALFPALLRADLRAVLPALFAPLRLADDFFAVPEARFAVPFDALFAVGMRSSPVDGWSPHSPERAGGVGASFGDAPMRRAPREGARRGTAMLLAARRGGPQPRAARRRGRRTSPR